MNKYILTFYCNYPDYMVELVVGELKWWQKIYVRFLLRPIMKGK